MRKLLAGAGLILFLSQIAYGQVAPSAFSGVRNTGIYGLFSMGRPNYGVQWLTGGTAGGYMQLSRFVGVDGRFTVLHWGPSPYHQYFVGAGPRTAYSFRRWTAFADIDAGVAHVNYPAATGAVGESHPAGSPSTFSWFLSGGVDYAYSRRLHFRVGQFDYGFVPVLTHGLNPKYLSAGIVVSLF